MNVSFNARKDKLILKKLVLFLAWVWGRKLTRRNAKAQLALFSGHLKIQTLHFFSRPRRFSQKSKTGFDGRVVCEAADIDPRPEFLPSILSYQMLQDVCQFYTMQGVIRLRVVGILIHGYST